MKRNFNHLLLFACLFAACSKNDVKPDAILNPDNIVLQEKYETNTFSVLTITADAKAADPAYEWVMTKNPMNEVTDSIVGKTKDFRFIAVYPGTYELSLNVVSAGKKGVKKTTINVINEAKNYSPYITGIYDFNPAPGMFANDLYVAGNVKTDVVRRALGRINETSVGYALDLGGFGGSIVIGFDHTVVNVAGQRDFRVYGGDLNDKADPPAPGLIYVAYDENKNGKPDEEEWYEIIGSQHTKENTLKNFKLTYHKKAAGVPLVIAGPNDPFSDREHIFCENNQAESYYMPRAKTKKEYYPLWTAQPTAVFEGMKLNVDFKPARAGQTTLWNFTAPEWGYVNSVDPDIDIDWAVDKNGKKAALPGIDFIKVVNCVSEPMGLCQQQSAMATKFSGAGDLHLLKKYNLR